MANFVRDHVSSGKIAGRAESRAQFMKEGKVDIELLIGGTIEWPDGGASTAATRVYLISEQDERWFPILFARPAKDIAPGIFGFGEDNRDKLLEFLFFGIRRSRTLNRVVAVWQLPEQLTWICSKQQRDYQDCDTAETTERNLPARHAATIFDVFTLPSIFPLHFRKPPRSRRHGDWD
jgi:hypothetical protein